MVAELDERHIRLVFAEVMDDVRTELDRYGILDKIGADALYTSVPHAAEAFKQATANG